MDPDREERRPRPSRTQYAFLHNCLELARRLQTSHRLPQALIRGLAVFYFRASDKALQEMRRQRFLRVDTGKDEWIVLTENIPFRAFSLPGDDPPEMPRNGLENLLTHWQAGITTFDLSHFRSAREADEDDVAGAGTNGVAAVLSPPSMAAERIPEPPRPAIMLVGDPVALEDPPPPAKRSITSPPANQPVVVEEPERIAVTSTKSPGGVQVRQHCYLTVQEASVLLEVADANEPSQLPLTVLLPYAAVRLRAYGILVMSGRGRGARWSVNVPEAQATRFFQRLPASRRRVVLSRPSEVVQPIQWLRDLKKVAQGLDATPPVSPPRASFLFPVAIRDGEADRLSDEVNHAPPEDPAVLREEPEEVSDATPA